MKIALAADHAGFRLKQLLRDSLKGKGYTILDFGTDSEDSTDYPDYAAEVGSAVAAGHADRGILICCTGVGMSIAANKVIGVRAALAINDESVRLTREHNDANVLAMGAQFFDADQASQLVDTFLNTRFSDGERHRRRIAKIAELEHSAEVAKAAK